MADQRPKVLGADAAREIGARFDLEGEVLFVVNYDRPFLTHRATWALALQSAGARCTVIAPDTGYRGALEAEGIAFQPMELARENTGAVAAAISGLRVMRSIAGSKANTVFLIQTAAYTLGGLVAPLARRKRFIRVAGGIGTALQPGQPPHKAWVVRTLLRFSSRFSNVFTLFQTEADKDFFLANKLANPSRSWLIPGTGIDTQTWKPNEAPDLIPKTVLFASRLTEEKGIREFVDMAARLEGSDLHFTVVGEPDKGNASHISQAELESWAARGAVTFLGHREDMPEVFSSSWLLVFPSRHPEGTPKTLIEAAACGLPAIVSDQPGCRSVITDGVTGWVTGDVSADALAAQVKDLLGRPDDVRRAAVAAREQAVEKYSLDTVLEILFQHLGIPKKVSIDG